MIDFTNDTNGGGSDVHNKGYFATETALTTAYPAAEVGDYAIVGSTDTVWVWDDTTSAWVDTDTKGQVSSVNGQTGTVVLTAQDVGATPFSTAMLSYPIGTEALTDTTLYNYIKTLYDASTTTGIKNNYTIVGTPTITSAGIASGFSTTSKIQIPSDITINSGQNSFRVKGKFNSSSNQTSAARIIDSASTGPQVRVASGNTAVGWSIYSNKTEILNRNADYTVANNTDYYYEINYDANSGTYNLLVGTSPDNLTVIDTYTGNAIGNYNWGSMFLGAYQDTSVDRSFNGKIDLNYFSIEVNNVIIFSGAYFQYKQLATGSKVVDVANLAQVQAIKNTEGSALYYVIDTTNETVRLPMGDIFGFLTQAMEQPTA